VTPTPKPEDPDPHTGAFGFTSDGELFDRLDATKSPEEECRGASRRGLLCAAIAGVVVVAVLTVWAREEAASAADATPVPIVQMVSGAPS
jgi:hypothetical protein